MRIAYQIPQSSKKACGRSFEDAFMLANPDLFEIKGTKKARETSAWDQAAKVDKTDFALKYAIQETDWKVPLYMEEGLQWLAKCPPPQSHKSDAAGSSTGESA